jgi:hypothetical protein
LQVVGALAVVAAAAAVFHWWSRPPALEFDNLKYIQLLSTAVSARNSDWLAKVGDAIAQQHEAGRMSKVELESLRRIIATAAAGDWAAADVECYELAAAQLSRRRSRPPSDQHDHDHGSSAGRTH